MPVLVFGILSLLAFFLSFETEFESISFKVFAIILNRLRFYLGRCQGNFHKNLKFHVGCDG